MSEMVITILVISGALSLILSAITLTVTIISLSRIKQKELHINQIHTAVSNIFVKAETINQNLGRVMNGLTEVLDACGDLIEKNMDKSGNGKIMTNLMTMDEFMNFVEGKSGDKNMSQDDLNELKRMFSSEIDDDDDDDEEDDTTGFKK
jgi:hypothetical protein